MGHEIVEKELKLNPCLQMEDVYWPKGETPRDIEVSCGGMTHCWADMAPAGFPAPPGGKRMLTETPEHTACKWTHFDGVFDYELQVLFNILFFTVKANLRPFGIMYWGQKRFDVSYFAGGVNLGDAPIYSNSIGCVLGTPACSGGSGVAHLDPGSWIPYLLAKEYGFMTQDDSLSSFFWIPGSLGPKSCTKLCNISDHSHIDIKFDTSEKWQLDNIG